MKRAFCPSRMTPMSLSSTKASICIWVRSSAMIKSWGAWKLAAMVWPSSTDRSITVPFMGERISVYPRLVCAFFNEALALFKLALAVRTWVFHCRYSVSEMCPFSNNGWLRLSSASSRSNSAAALSTLASASCTEIRKGVLSRTARSCPLVTVLLKSTFSSWTIPDTWEPTSTVSKALRVPVLETVFSILPRVRAAVVKALVSVFSFPEKNRNFAARPATMMIPIHIQYLRFIGFLLCCPYP